jgi:hypothetical protein
VCFELLLNYGHTLQCAWFTVVYLSTGVAMQVSRIPACIYLDSSLLPHHHRVCSSALRLVWKRSARRQVLSPVPSFVHTKEQQLSGNVMLILLFKPSCLTYAIFRMTPNR